MKKKKVSRKKRGKLCPKCGRKLISALPTLPESLKEIRWMIRGMQAEGLVPKLYCPDCQAMPT